MQILKERKHANTESEKNMLERVKELQHHFNNLIMYKCPVYNIE